MRRLLFIALFLSLSHGYSQKLEYAVLSLPSEITDGANAVVREQHIDIAVLSRRLITVKTRRVVTVLNEYGMRNINAFESRRVKSIGAVVYDALGTEIKKLRRSDFKEINVSDEAEITDQKLTVLEYTPVRYPFTIVYESEVADENTAFIPSWYPQSEPFVSVENTSLTVSFDPALGFRYKSFPQNDLVAASSASGMVSFTAQNLPARKNEDYAPSIKSNWPHVLFAIDDFHLEGVDGNAKSWESLSKWTYDVLLGGTDQLPQETVSKVRALVAGANDNIAKARIIYNYVQSKTRYISIQLGLGGWRPMKAADVDRLGYGDCKALTNYTRALLASVGVESYYAELFGGQKAELTPDFVSVQGNHVILAIPDGNSYVWLECTNQTLPFGFLGDFTSDRNALLIKSSGGGLVKTTSYPDGGNTMAIRGRYSIDETGSVSANVKRESRGLQFDRTLPMVHLSPDERNKIYLDHFPINNLKLGAIKVRPDMAAQNITEEIELSADRFANASGQLLIFPFNAFSSFRSVPTRYRKRTSPLEIGAGFHDTDEVTIEFPKGFALDAKPSDITISGKFGEYQVAFTQTDASTISYRRKLLIRSGNYPREEYESFQKFCEQISKADNSKIVLKKI